MSKESPIHPAIAHLIPRERDREPRGHVLAIRQPEDGALRARKVISRSKGRSSGKYPAWKLNRMVHWESPHELHAFRLLDANPAVLSFGEQPLVVSYVLDGIKHDHYPDIEVRTSDGRELWEVKTRADALSDDVAKRTQVLARGMKQFGYLYRVVLAEDLASQPRLENAQFILRHGRRPISDITRERARLQLEKHHVLTWGDILDGALGHQSRETACRLILEGRLHLDFHAPITRATPLHSSAFDQRLAFAIGQGAAA
jgi:hypothetical protein